MFCEHGNHHTTSITSHHAHSVPPTRVSHDQYYVPPHPQCPSHPCVTRPALQVLSDLCNISTHEKSIASGSWKYNHNMIHTDPNNITFLPLSSLPPPFPLPSPSPPPPSPHETSCVLTSRECWCRHVWWHGKILFIEGSCIQGEGGMRGDMHNQASHRECYH